MKKINKLEKQIDFISKSIKSHNETYDYSKVEYVNAKTKVCIICPIHGEFWQRPDHHINGSRCPKCAGVGLKSFEEFLEKANNRHNHRYKYIENTYTKTSEHVGIICPDHGIFYQNASSHLLGCGCPFCNGGIKITKDMFIKNAIKKHGDYYDYTKVEYVNANTKVCITCPRHGDFWQEADSHVSGKGCPKCKSSILENMVINLLSKNNIFYQYQYKLNDMGKKSYDFYLPDKNLLIECQGEQHFVPVDFSNNDNTNYNSINMFNKRILLDVEKYNAANKNGIKIAYFFIKDMFSYKNKDIDVNLPFYNDKNVFNHTDDLMKYIDSLESINTLNNTDIKFRKCLNNMNDNVVYQDDSFIIKNYKIYLIKCKQNDRDTLNYIDRTNRKKGYSSIFIFEDEFEYNELIVNNKLRHILGKDKDLQKIGARKTKISTINKKIGQSFLNKFHIQASGQSTISIGSYYNGELIAVMTFKILSNKKTEYELTRFASNYNYICQGVGSKMLSYFIKTYNPSSIISFADKRWTLDKNNNLYTKLGFTLVNNLHPDYRYYNEKVDSYKRFHKFAFRKQTLNRKYGLDMSMTESEMTKKLGYCKIWDCGLFKYKLEIKKENH